MNLKSNKLFTRLALWALVLSTLLGCTIFGASDAEVQEAVQLGIADAESTWVAVMETPTPNYKQAVAQEQGPIIVVTATPWSYEGTEPGREWTNPTPAPEVAENAQNENEVGLCGSDVYQDGRIVVASQEGEGQVSIETYLSQNFSHLIARMEGFEGDQTNQQGEPNSLSDVLYYMGATTPGTVISIHFRYPDGPRETFATAGYLDEACFGHIITVGESIPDLSMTGGSASNGYLVVVYNSNVHRDKVSEDIARSWIDERIQNN